jgi:hypothetical protein
LKTLNTAQRRGIAFERAVGKTLARGFDSKRVIAGPWLEFEDRTGYSYCQPDFVVLADDYTNVVECKYSYTDRAADELNTLYGPLAELYWEKPVRLISAFHIAYEPGDFCVTLGSAFERPSLVEWHVL